MLLSGCSSNDNNSANTLRIGVALYTQDDTFISSIVQNLEKLAQQNENQNLKINITIMDGKSNQTTQMEQIDQLIRRGCNFLCVNIVDRTAASVLIDKAKEADIPVIFFNRQPVAEDMERWEKAYYVGSKAEEGGKLQGQIVLDAWLNNKNIYDKNNDDTIQYVMLEGEPAHQDTLLRTEYSVKTLTDNDIKVEKLASDSANWSKSQAINKTTEWINQFNNNIEVVFANNDDMALGAIDAFTNAGLDIPLIVGVDAIPSAIDAIKNGTLCGTVKNDAYGMASTMLDLILKLYNDEKIDLNLQDEHYLWLQYEIITIKNA
ncbi:MAG TPA: galactose ABC transporter substrate-binding protein [Candidatus Butyricicoccus avistercoris]|uniref:D-galactose/methyl-galactoside binding periplasmic protein MglB n=1 Tax=Candidatus Butyricicoccus avistercoris TaxID=2838518 RepID=A0A9D1PHA3_9FIRM|nr:galactose ABC transporter substrate-binding protein [Candidatus Butyricicoccus avistercoris]